MPKTEWKLRFAPHLGFRDRTKPLFVESAGSSDPVDQIAYAAGLGFAGVFDAQLVLRPVEEQERIGRALEKHGLEMGCFVLRPDPEGLAVGWGADSAELRETLDRNLGRALEAARRVNGRYISFSSRRDLGVVRAFEYAGMIKNLRRLAPVAEKAGVNLCIEHVNAPRLPDRLLQHVADSYMVACAAGSDAVKIVFDTVHVQMMDGSLIDNADRCLDKIASFQLADVPGRLEPGTGEINFVALLRHIRRRGFNGLMELEYLTELPGKAGEELALERLRAINAQL
jgi:hydroxypyruvate isomerase